MIKNSYTMRALFAIFSATLIIAFSCSDDGESPDLNLREKEDTIMYFIGEIFEEQYNWVMSRSVFDTLIIGYGSIDPYNDVGLRELTAGISYGSVCCQNIPEEIKQRIQIQVVDSLDYEPDDIQDQERLKSIFETGRKKISYFNHNIFLPPEVVLKYEETLTFNEFEVVYMENIDGKVHYYSSKWGVQDEKSTFAIIRNESYFTCIDSFDKITRLCDSNGYVIFIIDCKLYNQQGQFATWIKGEFKISFAVD